MQPAKFRTYKCGVIKSKHDPRDLVAESIYSSRLRLLFPESVDLRPDLQPVIDQGPTNTCAAQTAACIKEWQEKQDVKLNEHFAPQFIYNLRSNIPEEGMYPRDVMKILSKYGCCTEKSLPFNSCDKKEDIKQPAYDEAKRYLIKSYAQINTIDGVKAALLKNGPCLIAFPCYNFGETFWKPVNQFEKLQGGHAVTIVGYTKDAFIIRNSWGSDWGDKGYTYYPFSQFGMHWEIWGCIDEKSPTPDFDGSTVPVIPSVIKKGWCC